jgi:hypothetical protein
LAIRTSASAVEAIIEVDSSIPLDPFMETANLLVNRICVPAKNEDGTPYFTDDAELEVIERWLSAHFYAVRDPRIQFEAVKSLMTRFESKVELNLNNTRYGQQALVLDTSGELAAYNRTLDKGPIKRRVGAHWLGVPPDSSDE